jgi:hypothetical protein
MVTRHRIQAHLRGKPHGLVKNEIEKVKVWAVSMYIYHGLSGSKRKHQTKERASLESPSR